ncbi:hypothetical protein KOJCDNHJ_04304 [Xanthomonas citri pv. punicae]|uniref:Glycosyltransferase family 1 protein n=1 Tax=Xanthomonas citri pv. punicae TaxID=487838 RepID=A0A088FSM0_XANCI|nr:hypothetical protein [Xanthomonas citri pv. punicae]UIE43651.1 hypothetical protein FICKIIDM_02766 [Xanthomonas citri pv. punicae]UIS30864.1 hypothetical protein KOJCDNHJ_04304 [Xanthomonas citri pv. punicae]CCF67380.1 hypothetical protein XAPC_1072 [Xanthomonas citri pv. punicae str. LMG 859]
MLDRLLRRAARGLRTAVVASDPVRTSVGEITPCEPRAEERQGRRLNLILPSINKQHYFGGIHTAVLIYRELCRYFDESRIILVDSAPDDEALARFGDHQLVNCGQESKAPRQIVAFNDRYEQTLPVAAGDHWLATAWWTAYSAQRLATWQSAMQASDRPVMYLIQDYEPGFYAWSSQSALAMSTYRKDRDIAIFNTSLLRDYFARQGFDYQRAVTFEPVLHDGLKATLERVRSAQQTPRQRVILTYARPGTPRNAFELLCEGLRKWGWADSRCADWRVLAVGELDSDVDLGPFVLQALGKLSIDQYAELLSTSSLGISLMVSPHPSYPPLEMDAFGMSVITNQFANKDLSASHANIVSLETMTPEAIAAELSRQIDVCESRQMLSGPLAALDNAYVCQGRDAFSAMVDDAAILWGANQVDRV